MNVNIKLSLSDEERNLIARKIAGKDIKRLCSRADVVEMVNGFMAGFLTEVKKEAAVKTLDTQPSPLVAPDLSLVPEKYADQTDQWKISYLRGRYGR